MLVNSLLSNDAKSHDKLLIVHNIYRYMTDLKKFYEYLSFYLETTVGWWVCFDCPLQPLESRYGSGQWGGHRHSST